MQEMDGGFGDIHYDNDTQVIFGEVMNINPNNKNTFMSNVKKTINKYIFGKVEQQHQNNNEEGSVADFNDSMMDDGFTKKKNARNLTDFIVGTKLKESLKHKYDACVGYVSAALESTSKALIAFKEAMQKNPPHERIKNLVRDLSKKITTTWNACMTSIGKRLPIKTKWQNVVKNQKNEPTQITKH